MRDDFAIFILTHGRPDNQKTLEALKNAGYTGKVYLVVDNLDKTIDSYMAKYRSTMLVFDKMRYVEYTDTGLASPLINFAVFARNAIEDFAKSLGYRFFGMFDDDILKFRHRKEENGKLLSVPVCNLDQVIENYIDFMEKGKISCTSFGVVTQYIGGLARFQQRIESSNSLRCCFNAYIRDSEYKVDWKTNMCEDRITSMFSNQYGQVWQQLLFVQIDTAPLYGVSAGGNSDVYRDTSKFMQVFFPVVTHPSINFIYCYNNHLVPRIFGENNICGKIISGRYKK